MDRSIKGRDYLTLLTKWMVHLIRLGKSLDPSEFSEGHLQKVSDLLPRLPFFFGLTGESQTINGSVY